MKYIFFPAKMNCNFVSSCNFDQIKLRFVESLNDPKTDPVAIWTNGGPGASGLLGMVLCLFK